MLRWFPTPTMSARFPSSRPTMTSREPPHHHRWRPQRPCASRLSLHAMCIISTILDASVEIRSRHPQQNLRLGLAGNAHLTQALESGFLVRANRTLVAGRGSDDADVGPVERQGDVAQELAEHGRPVTPTDQVGLADEEVDTDGALTERERPRVVAVIVDEIVLEHPDRPIAEPCHVPVGRSEEHTSELQSPDHLVCRLLLEKKKKKKIKQNIYKHKLTIQLI